MIRGARIGVEYADARVENLIIHPGIQEAWERLRVLLEGRGYSVLLVGPPGTGKTRLLATVLHELDSRWPYGRYVYWTMPELAERRRDAVAGDWLDPIEACIEAHITILDDLGAEKTTDYGREGLYRILDERRRAGRITLAATNLTVQELPRVYGDRIVSRFLGPHGTIALVSGQDWRGRQAANPTPVAWAPGLGERT